MDLQFFAKITIQWKEREREREREREKEREREREKEKEFLQGFRKLYNHNKL